jgi:hypothetical protein
MILRTYDRRCKTDGASCFGEEPDLIPSIRGGRDQSVPIVFI